MRKTILQEHQTTMVTTWDGIQQFTRLLAVDPGDKHVGVAFFEAIGDPADDQNWRCADTLETTPEEFEDAILETLADGDIDILVCERFSLYEDKATVQSGSEFRTSQMIGVIKFAVRIQNKHAEFHVKYKDRVVLPCQLQGNLCHNPDRQTAKFVTLDVSQGGGIQKPTQGILRHKKIKSVAKQNNDKLGHQLSAELHGWHYILNTRHGKSLDQTRNR